MTVRKIAMVYDVDNTLVDGYHPNIILKRKGVDVNSFWRKIEDLQGFEQGNGIKAGQDILYLSYFLFEAWKGKLKRLRISEIEEMGADLEKMLYPGLPAFFDKIKEANPAFDVSHYLLSSGIQHLLEGSCLADHVARIIGYTFFEENGMLGILSSCSSREKIPFLVDISYGAYAEHGPSRARGRYEYPFEDMMYFGDQQTDRPLFLFLKKRGGTTFCVFDSQKPGSYEKAKYLENDVHYLLPADYQKGSELWDCVVQVFKEKEKAL